MFQGVTTVAQTKKGEMMKKLMLAASAAVILAGCAAGGAFGPAPKDGELAQPTDYKSWPVFLAGIEKPTGHIRDIYINPNFDSVLEARFIESLKRMGGVGGLPRVKLVQDIVNGKSGFVIEVGTQRYKIEPQVNEGPSTGVAVASKPDFVIWPWQSGTLRKPVVALKVGRSVAAQRATLSSEKAE